MMNDPKRIDFSKYPRQELNRDEVLFTEGDQSQQIYVLLLGSLGIFRDDICIATLEEPLSVVGEMSGLTAGPRGATVRALKLSKLVVIDDPDRLFHEYPQMGAKLARLLASRVEKMNQKFVELKSIAARATSSDAAPAAAASPIRVVDAERMDTDLEYQKEMFGALSDLLDWDLEST